MLDAIRDDKEYEYKLFIYEKPGYLHPGKIIAPAYFFVEEIGSDFADARAVLQRFGQVGGGNIHAAGKVGDGAGEFEDAVVGAGGELQLVHGGAHQSSAGFIQGAILAHLRRVHIRVGG